MAMISSQEYCRLAGIQTPSPSSPDTGFGYAALPSELVEAELSIVRQDPARAFALNKSLCRGLLDQFTLTNARWSWPEQFHALYRQQLERIENQLADEPDSYFSFSNDAFRKDLAILRHRLIPFGAELATPYSGLSRRLIITGGWRQAGKFLGAVALSGGIKPFLELHMHPRDRATFNPAGWLETYENLADFLAVNPDLRGVQSTSWFLDPALEQVSPHLAYLRQIPELCGAAILYAGADSGEHSGAFATSKTRRALHRAGWYHPRLFTRIWPRQMLLRRGWRAFSGVDTHQQNRDGDDMPGKIKVSKAEEGSA